MKNTLLFLICFSFFACKKSSNVTPFQSATNGIGLQLEHPYVIYNFRDTIVFHANQTITETGTTSISAAIVSITYNFHYSLLSNLTTSIFKNGYEMMIFVDSNTYKNSSPNHLVVESLLYGNASQLDTSMMAIYLSSPPLGSILVNNMPTLIISPRYNSNGNNSFSLFSL